MDVGDSKDGPPDGLIRATDTELTNTTNSWWTSSSTIVSPAAVDVMNQLCRVCGEPAAGFHFGAFTCEGCKSFFGRTYNNPNSIAECKNGGICIINKKTRTACKACRLRKCLMVGMSKSGSRYGRRSNWFKTHCLLQKEIHQAQQALRKTEAHPLENNENSSTSAGASQRFYTSETSSITSPTTVSRPEMMYYDFSGPEASRFSMWRRPAFTHFALNPLHLFNTLSYITYINQLGPQVPVASLSNKSRGPSTEVDASELDMCSGDDSRPFGPIQEEPMDLTKKQTFDDVG